VVASYTEVGEEASEGDCRGCDERIQTAVTQSTRVVFALCDRETRTHLVGLTIEEARAKMELSLINYGSYFNEVVVLLQGGDYLAYKRG